MSTSKAATALVRLSGIDVLEPVQLDRLRATMTDLIGVPMSFSALDIQEVPTLNDGWVHSSARAHHRIGEL